MSQLAQTRWRIFEDDLFTLDHAEPNDIRGYLILRLKSPATSLGELSLETARALGPMLSKATAAIEQVTGADRVYCLTFAELDRRLHFHLFPRTHALLEAYWTATGTRDLPINGPMLFEWARTARVASGTDVPGGLADVCAALRERWSQGEGPRSTASGHESDSR
jgi:diadenosine tetraphosphate (Ap4A) HIT family hydrolase